MFYVRNRLNSQRLMHLHLPTAYSNIPEHSFGSSEIRRGAQEISLLR